MFFENKKKCNFLCLNLVYCLLVSFDLWAFLFVLFFCLISWVFEKLFQGFSDAVKQLEDYTEGEVALRRQQQKEGYLKALDFLSSPHSVLPA